MRFTKLPTDLASARFISYGTWKWAELQMKTGGKPVYRYLYARPRPAYLGMPGESVPAAPAAGRGGNGEDAARPANRGTPRCFAFRRDPIRHGQPRSRQALHLGARRLRSIQDMQAYFVNFIKTFNPKEPACQLAGLPCRR